MWQQWANTILGLIIAASPLFMVMSVTLIWTAVIIGLAIAVLGIWGAAQTSSERGQNSLRHAQSH